MALGWRSLTCAVLSSFLCASSTGLQPRTASISHAPTDFDGRLSVLTYNVKGLPWPIARDRPANLHAIARRLRDLRREGLGPQVIVLQEAFTEEARAIGQESGYRYVLDGPSVTDMSRAPMTVRDLDFLAGASTWHGETLGALLGSGLRLMSDYPVIAVHRMAYPAFACAGFDCLASKGAMLVSLQIPGVPTPVDVVTTHLNSRNSSGVSDARSLYAYRRQTELLSTFINTWHDPARPLIVAGDFNTGRARPRWRALLDQIATWRGGSPFGNALPEVARRNLQAHAPVPDDLRAILRRGSDWQFFASGSVSRLRAEAVRVPFGPDAAGEMLSDHIGYISQFRLDRRGG